MFDYEARFPSSSNVRLSSKEPIVPLIPRRIYVPAHPAILLDFPSRRVDPSNLLLDETMVALIQSPLVKEGFGKRSQRRLSRCKNSLYKHIGVYLSVVAKTVLKFLLVGIHL